MKPATRQRILQVLAEQKRRQPVEPFLETSEIIKALGLPPNQPAVSTALSRMVVEKLVVTREASRGRSYAISPSGERAPKQASGPRPWRPGTLMTTAHATYSIVERLRPLDRPPSARVEVFKATVQTVTTSRVASALAPGRTVVIKTIPNHQLERLGAPKAHDRANYLTDLMEVFAAETQKLETAPILSCAATTFDWDRETLYIRARRPLQIPFVVQEYIDGPDLPAFFSAGLTSPFTGLSSLEQWFDLAESLAKGLQDVHAAAKFHRYIWPGTIFMRPDGPVFVDLIEAAFHVPAWPGGSTTTQAADGAAESTQQASAGSLDPDAFVDPEWRAGKRREPRRTADLYSLGAVLYYAATGRSPQFDATDTEGLKKAVGRALQGTIASENYGVADIISRCLRHSLNERVSDTHTLLSDIRLFRGSPRVLHVQDALNLVGRVNSAISRSDDVFASLAAVEFEQFERAIAEIESGSLTIGEGHDNLVVKLCGYLSTLGEGDEYWAVTVPDFWRAHNLGIRGRYLSMNAEIVRRGARVLRVFLLTDDDRRDPEVRLIVAAQREIERDLAQQGTKIKGSLDLRYRRVTDVERRQAVTSAQQVGLWVRGDSLVQVHPIYNSKGVINRVTIRRPSGDKAEIKKTWLDRFFDGARPLTGWFSDD